MAETIGEVLPFAVGVALSPLPIVAVILMLFTRRARVNGPIFVLGWVVGLAVVGCIVLAVSHGGGAVKDGEPATWVGVLKLALGVLLLRGAVRTWRRRPGEGEEPAMPKWMAAIDHVTPPKAFGLAALLAGVNPKNLLLTVGAATAIATARLKGTDEVAALAVFVVLGSLTIAAPVVVSLVSGAKAERSLSSARAWLVAHNDAVMSVLFVVFAFVLIGDALEILA